MPHLDSGWAVVCKAANVCGYAVQRRVGTLRSDWLCLVIYTLPTDRWLRKWFRPDLAGINFVSNKLVFEFFSSIAEQIVTDAVDSGDAYIKRRSALQ